MIEQEKCKTEWKLNCGCCADVELLVCELDKGHDGMHYESFDGGKGLLWSIPKYQIKWADND